MAILKNLSKQYKIAIGVVIFFFIVFNVQTYFNHYLYRTDALDYGFHLQALRNFCNCRSGPLTIFSLQLESFFQIHPSFTLAIISPIACLLKPIFGSYTLLLIMNIFITLGGYFTYKVILLRSKDEWLSLIAVVHYFVIGGHYSAISFGYVDPVVSAAVVPIFLYYFYKEKYWVSLIFMFFVITSRENMPLWFIFIGIFLLIDTYKNKKSRYWSIGVSTISLLYLVLVFTVLIPAFNVESSEYSYNRFTYTALGENVREAFVYAVTHPIDVVKLMFVNHLNEPMYDGIKAEFWLAFLVSGGILLFRRPHYFIPFIPVILQKLLSDNMTYWGLMIFSSVEIVSILTFASFSILASLKNRKLAKIIGIILCASTLTFTIIKMNTRTSKWYNSAKEKIYDPKFYKSDYNIAEIKEVLSLIPDDANVCASSTLVPHLSFRDRIYYFPYFQKDVEYLTFLINGPPYPFYKEEYARRINDYENSEDWEVVRKTKDIILLKKKQLNQPD